MAEYCPYIQFQFFNSLGQKLNIPNDLVTSAVWARTINSVGTAVLELPSDCTDIEFRILSQEDLGLLINVAPEKGQAAIPDLETFWFLRRFKETIVDKKGSYKLTFKDANHLLDRRIVAYRADDPQGSSPTTRIEDPGNIALRNIFDTNFINTNDPDRNISPFVSVAGIAAPSPIIAKEIPWKNILRTMQQICRTSRDKGTELFFDLVALATATDVRFEFRTYLNQRGSDKTFEIIHTTNPYFKLTSFEIDYDVPNIGYAGGIGRGQDRQIAIATNIRADRGRYTRFEDFKSVRSGIGDAINDEAQNLVNNSAGVIRLEGQLLGQLSQSFGFGDRLTIHHRGLEIVCEVASISSNFTNQEYVRTVVVKSVGE